MDNSDFMEQFLEVWTPNDEQLSEIIAAFPKRKKESHEAWLARLTRESQIYMLQHRLGITRQTAMAYVKRAEAAHATQS